VARSLEYPDLQWVPPRSWTNANRSSVQLVVMHTTQGSYHSASAEDGARYNQIRTDGTSCHYFHDSDSTVQGVYSNDISHSAKKQGNLRGIHHELCGRAEWTPNHWDNDYQRKMLARAAKQVARDCKKWGIPARKLSVAQVAAGVKGICSHFDITRAFPEDKGTHWDPGPDFPWDEFIKQVNFFLNPPKPPEEDDMPTALEIQKAVWSEPIEAPAIAVADFGGKNPTAEQALKHAMYTKPGIEQVARQNVVILANQAKMMDQDFVDEEQVATAFFDLLKLQTPDAVSATLVGLFGLEGALGIADKILSQRPQPEPVE